MNYVVLAKQVPDIKNIPNEAWDWEKGTLKRALLENVCNELDKQALAFALGMRQKTGGQVVALSMGPPFAEEVLRYAMAIGADAGVLLTDKKLGGADTAATAYPLAQAVRKIEQEIFGGDRDYVVVCGMQSIDGDTAQVPPQIAEELGIVHIAYATSFDLVNTELQVGRITARGRQILTPNAYPCVVTVASWTEPLNASFSRTRWAHSQQIYRWGVNDIDADEALVGAAGSRTTVFKIFSPKEVSKRNCVFVDDMVELARMLGEAYRRKAQASQELEVAEAYQLPESKSPTYAGEIWVYAEHENGQINPASFELLGKATELAKPLSEKVGAVILGKDMGELLDELVSYRADRVYFSQNILLKDFLPVPYAKVISGMIETYLPQIMLFGATPSGRELGPRVAYRSKSGLTADCTGLDIVDFQRAKRESIAVLKQTRPALGGNIMASILTQNSRVQMSTARPGVFKALEPDQGRSGEMIEFTVDIGDLGARIVSSESVAMTSDITEAVGIACGGAGCKTKDNFERYLEPLADSLGKFLGERATVGASRAAVELGFIDRSRQIGQTGHTVRPRVYIAVGISGAVQHITGMQNSDIVVAINKDRKAPIFKEADFGVIADMDEVIPELIAALNSQGSIKD